MKYAVSSLMVAVSALAFSANANASDFKPYVGLDYNYTDADADHQSPKYNSASVNVGTEYNKYFGTEVSTSIPMTTKNMLTALKIKLLSRLTVWI